MKNESTPSAVEVEEVVLGAIILEPTCLWKIAPDLSPQLFYKEANSIIVKSILEMFATNETIDIVTIVNRLKTEKKLDTVGGAYYVSSLTNRVASSANLEFHVKILQERLLERNVLTICNRATQRVLVNKDDVFEVYSGMQVELDNSIKQVLHYDVSRVEDIHLNLLVKNIQVAQKGTKSGVTTGLRLLDNLTNGWQNSDLIILAGRPSMGKSAAALCWALQPALNGTAVGVFSLEMSKEQLVGRIQSYLSGVNVSRIIKSQLTMGDIDIIDNSCQCLKDAQLYIDDTPNISLIELKAKARKLVNENGVKLIIVDYLQLMRSGRDIQHREQEVAEISRGLKALAKELDIPVIALAQLSRAVDGTADKKPMLSHLRESGAIEQDADMVMFCYRPAYYGIEQYEVGGQMLEADGLFMLIVAKHRNGELGEVPLKFIGEQTKITNYDMFTQSNEPTPTQSERQEPKLEQKQETINNNTDFLSQKNEQSTNWDDVPF